MEQQKYKVEYYKENRYKKKDSNGMERWTTDTNVEECELLVIPDSEVRHQIIKRMPHPIARETVIKLWKFFIKFVNGKPIQLENPRYMIQVGHHWFKIKSMELV